MHASSSSGPEKIASKPEPILKASALGHVVFERRDVEIMIRFLEDFGLVVVDHGDGASRFLRGYGNLPYCVEIVPSDRDAFVGFSFVAENYEDLVRLAAETGAAIEPADGPGGGQRVRLADPDGVRVDLLHGFTPTEELPTRDALSVRNTPKAQLRVNQPVRTECLPAPVFRIGHVVLQTPAYDTVTQWYMRHLGVILTDVLTIEDGRPALSFFRLDRGTEPTDHHTLAILSGPSPALLHISTETTDVDAVGQGHQYLRGRGWTHYWGIGRHLLGSQVFDYWKDPAGDEWEHYADGDLMTADYPTGTDILSRGGLWVWGDDLPDSMRPKDAPPREAPSFAHGMFAALSASPRPWLP